MDSPPSPSAGVPRAADDTAPPGAGAKNAAAQAADCGHSIDLQALYGTAGGSANESAPVLRGTGFARHRLAQHPDVLLDRFSDTGAACAALRFSAGPGQRRVLGVAGGYRVQVPAAGGWLLTPASQGLDAYWIPQQAVLRRLDRDGHILSHRPAAFAGLDVSASGLAVHVLQPEGMALDLVVWRLPAAEPDLLQALQSPSALERQRYFMWSSHTSYARPADLYLHWVHGHVYENHEVWPKYWRVCSELDAYALYVTLTGLLRATGKRLYDLLRRQVVFSVIARQSGDGGWYHGEWTDGMESHYRLHAGAMHLLAAHVEETGDETAGQALDRAAAFAATKTDRLDAGAWYLHDSLEDSREALQRYPFRYVPSRALGKSASNLLVLNTHLDTNIAMARHRQVRGNGRHGELIASAQAVTQSVLQLRPAEWLYRPLFKAIALTFLPKGQAQTLPLPQRALKRVAWKYLIPWLPRIKSWFPRLVMPGGYVERELTMRAFSVRYQPVNLMDLARTRHVFGENTLDPLLAQAFGFTHDCGLTGRWKELKGKEDDSLGFWAEALYHLCLQSPDLRYRAWLAEAVIDLEDNRLGLPPSLLGTNAEAIAPAQQHACPSPDDDRLRVVNLSRGTEVELLVVNPSAQALALGWAAPLPDGLTWSSPGHQAASVGQDLQAVPSRRWIRGMGRPPARS